MIPTTEFNRAIHCEKLQKLAEKDIWVGTSSWKYPGWKGQIYDKANKSTPSKELLAQYVKVFPSACNDATYYPPPPLKQRELEDLNAILPATFRMAFKVSQYFTVRTTERHHTFGRPGEHNPGYLDPDRFHEEFLAPIVDTLGDKTGPLILEFSSHKWSEGWNSKYPPSSFVRDLDYFLGRVSKDLAPIAVEVRDRELLELDDYLLCLKDHGITHVLNEQTSMPPLIEQLRHPNIRTTDITVVRALVRPGVKHNEAVDEFQPYDHTQLEMPFMRDALKEILLYSLSNRMPLYMYVNNRTEGNAPNTIASVIDQLELL